jgi:hypothetical protein
MAYPRSAAVNRIFSGCRGAAKVKRMGLQGCFIAQ